MNLLQDVKEQFLGHNWAKVWLSYIYKFTGEESCSKKTLSILINNFTPFPFALGSEENKINFQQLVAYRSSCLACKGLRDEEN